MVLRKTKKPLDHELQTETSTMERMRTAVTQQKQSSKAIWPPLGVLKSTHFTPRSEIVLSKKRQCNLNSTISDYFIGGWNVVKGFRHYCRKGVWMHITYTLCRWWFDSRGPMKFRTSLQRIVDPASSSSGENTEEGLSVEGVLRIVIDKIIAF